MARTLLVPHDNGFLDDVLDHLDVDPDVEVAFDPTPAQWRAAPLVLLDARARALVDGLEAHPHPFVIIGRGATPPQVAALYERWRDALPGVTVYQWPHGAEAVRELVAEARTGARRPELRIGVVGGHGGAGASTLSVALAHAACHAGRRTVLIDGDPLGGGIAGRIGGDATAVASLRIVGQDDVQARPGGLVEVIRRTSAEVKVTDLSRSLDGGQLAAAAVCDVVLVVTDGARNMAATRRVLTTLSDAEARLAVVGRSDTDHAADYLASDYTAPRAGDMPPDDRAVCRFSGLVELAAGGPLSAFAAELLTEVPDLSDAAAR